MPVQVFLNIDGDLFLRCSDLGQISQKLIDNRFEVLIHDGPSNIGPGDGCGDATKPFEKIIPLSVYGLSAGTYEYSVNGGNIGTFTLTVDNKL